MACNYIMMHATHCPVLRSRRTLCLAMRSPNPMPCYAKSSTEMAQKVAGRARAALHLAPQPLDAH
eukprot:3941946-Rhodomonas_salina.8